MEFATRSAGTVLVLEPLGTRLDASDAQSFKAEVLGAIETGSRRLVIDLHNVAFMDSAALGVLVAGLKRLGADGRLTVCAPQAPVRSILEITRLHRAIPIFASEAEALRSFEIP